MKAHYKTVHEWIVDNSCENVLSLWSPINEAPPANTEYKSALKYYWRCELSHDYSSTLQNIKKGQRCPYCAGQKPLSGFNDLATKYPSIASEWDHELNDNVLPENVMPGSEKKYWWKCPFGHHYQTSVVSRTHMNSGCPYCANQKVLLGFNDLATKYPEIATEWCWEKNENSPSEYVFGSSKKVWWRCQKGHCYEASISSRTKQGTGCPYCSNVKVWPGFNDLKTRYPEIAQEWDYKNNATLDPTCISPHSGKKVWWKCSFGHKYKKRVAERVNQLYGCPTCANELQTSFPEQAIYYYLKQVFPSAQNRSLVYEKELDVYVPELNLGIEYDGIYYHSSEKKKKEMEKDSYFNNMGIHIIRIKEGENPKKKLEDSVIWVAEKKPDIRRALTEIAKKYDFIDRLPYIDVEADRFKIWEQYITTKKSNSLATLFPELASEWNSTRNKGLMPEQVSAYNDRKVWWKCSMGHEYEAVIRNRTKLGSACPYCAGQKAVEGVNDLSSINPSLLKEWDHRLNGSIDPSKVSIRSNKKVYWHCNKGHQYLMSPNERARGHACPFCAGRKILIGYNDLKSKFPNLAAEWDYSKNIDIGPENITYGSSYKAYWLCSKGHSYQAAVCDRTQGKGCPYCAGKRVLIGFNDLASQFPEIAVEWDSEKNGSVTPDSIVWGSAYKAFWKCKNGHSFQQPVVKRTRRGYGCPYCRKEHR